MIGVSASRCIIFGNLILHPQPLPPLLTLNFASGEGGGVARSAGERGEVV